MTTNHDNNVEPSTIPASKAYPCPQCGKAATWQNNPAKPFCSPRCKLIDLGAWASEDYKISATDAPFSDELDPYQS